MHGANKLNDYLFSSNWFVLVDRESWGSADDSADSAPSCWISSVWVSSTLPIVLYRKNSSVWLANNYCYNTKIVYQNFGIYVLCFMKSLRNIIMFQKFPVWGGLVSRTSWFFLLQLPHKPIPQRFPSLLHIFHYTINQSWIILFFIVYQARHSPGLARTAEIAFHAFTFMRLTLKSALLMSYKHG